MKLIFTCLLTLLITTLSYAQDRCDTWVNLQNRFSAITVGDLDITGDQLTIEANFNMTGPSVNIVSKHWGGFDVNYLLRPSRGEITTDGTGFIYTDEQYGPCGDTLRWNKTCHVAMVYNGSTLKFYRNGSLISSVAAFGNLVTNNWLTSIGEHAPVVTPTLNGAPNPDYHNQDENQGFYDESFRGFINEVRIWNVARTQEQIKQYMNDTLPEPTSQTGLLGYWVFNSLQNRQGNATYDGSIEGLAAIGQTNTNCDFIIDPCCSMNGFHETNSVQNDAIELTWEMMGEGGIQSYVLQRSETVDFANVSDITTKVPGAGSYSFSDNTVTPNKDYYYRVKVKALAGSVSYTHSVKGKIIKPDTVPLSSLVEIYPNPVKSDVLNIKLNSADVNVIIVVMNSSGQLMINKNLAVLPGATIPVDLSRLEKGSYYVRVVTPGKTTIKKIIRL